MSEMLPPSEWLSQAKRLPVGRSERVFHGREGRPNLVVYNSESEWSAYCHRCHKAGRVSKTHVVIGAPLDARRPDPTPPQDCVPLFRPGVFCEYDAPVASFLFRKNMVPSLLPPLSYSPSRKRIVLTANGVQLGRDITELSVSKWMQYGRKATYFRIGGSAGLNPDMAILVEDTFSAYKVARAVPALPVVCCLGTHLSPALRLALPKLVVVMFDGDIAGYTGAAEAKRNLPLAVVSIRCAPEGMDPKDMSIACIRSHLGGLHGS